MTPALMLLARLTLVLAAGLVLAHALRRHAAAVRHAVLVTAVLGALVMPLAILVAPAWGPTLVRPASTGSPATGEPAVTVAVTTSAAPRTDDVATPLTDPIVTPSRMLALAWLVVAATGLARLARDGWRIRALAEASTPLVDARWAQALTTLGARAGVTRSVELRVGDAGAPVITWGVRRPRVLLPREALTWPEPRVRHVLAHELAHIARRDWPLHLVLAVAAAVYAWHPLMRRAVRRAHREAERACDDAVLATGATATAYASTLIDVARTSRAHAAVATLAMADPSSLERRIAAMLDASLDHTHAPRHARRFVGLVAAFTLAVAGLSAQAQGTGTVSGTVLPTGGTPIADVAVSFVGATTVSATTDAQGRFSATLPAGTYRAEIKKPGFKAFSARVDVTAGANTARDFALALGQVQETISVTGGSSAAPTLRDRTREATGPTPTRPAGTIAPPLKLRDVKPVYDEALKAAGVSGKVVVEARIGADGYVTDTRVVSSPDERLSAAAIEAIEQWKFAPTLLQGKPVATDMQVTITFAAK